MSPKRAVIVPTFHEVKNIRPLTERVFAALKSQKMDAELIFVDDNSGDGTEEQVAELSKTYNVRIIVRKNESGLSSAVLRGFKEAEADHLLCMDADLQHPPEKVPEMFKSLEKNTFVLGTRYGKSFNVDKGWAWYRVIISKGGRMLARPLTPLSDPMSGFFGLRRDTLQQGLKHVNPLGFKIALELYVKCGCKQHGEVEIHFGQRVAGESKLTGKVMAHYLVHLQDLYRFRFPWLLPLLILLFLVFCYTVYRYFV